MLLTANGNHTNSHFLSSKPFFGHIYSVINVLDFISLSIILFQRKL